MDKNYKLKVIYFAIKGRAEPIRLMLHRGGIEFENVTLTKEEFATQKAAGAFPFGQLPIMEVNGKVVAQSNGLSRLAARLSKHYPEDLYLAAKCDEVIGVVEDLRSAIVPSLYESDEAKKLEMRKQLSETKIPTGLGYLEKLLEQNGTGFFVGNSLTWADVETYVAIGWLKSGMLDGIPTTIVDKFAKLSANWNLVNSDPKIAEWNGKSK